MKNFLLVLVLTSITSAIAQEPIKDLSIGNSWTYRDAGHHHGGVHWDYYQTRTIIGDTTINNYNFSAYNVPIYERSDSALIERHWYCSSTSVDSFITEVHCDFTMLPGDTLITTTGMIVMLSRGDSVFFGENQPYIRILTTGCRYDSWTDHVLLISKKFGLIHMDANGIDLWFDIWLKGALIDGVLYGDTTVVSVDEFEEIPIQFALEQNYPNPFNPFTTIKFSIPFIETGHAPYVQLKVYNVLGTEVATLIHEEKSVGTYEVEFDASNLPSGVYFYRLQAGSFRETKKMLILK